MAGDRATRLLDQQATDVVVIALHDELLVEHGDAGRRQHAAGDHVADLALGMTTDNCDDPARLHLLALDDDHAHRH